ncbi:hypothetical protein ACFLZV_04875 [Candidatus Margulisiibacteriota bacterium]
MVLKKFSPFQMDEDEKKVVEKSTSTPKKSTVVRITNERENLEEIIKREESIKVDTELDTKLLKVKDMDRNSDWDELNKIFTDFITNYSKLKKEIINAYVQGLLSIKCGDFVTDIVNYFKDDERKALFFIMKLSGKNKVNLFQEAIVRKDNENTIGLFMKYALRDKNTNCFVIVNLLNLLYKTHPTSIISSVSVKKFKTPVLENDFQKLCFYGCSVLDPIYEQMIISSTSQNEGDYSKEFVNKYESIYNSGNKKQITVGDDTKKLILKDLLLTGSYELVLRLLLKEDIEFAKEFLDSNCGPEMPIYVNRYDLHPLLKKLFSQIVLNAEEISFKPNCPLRRRFLDHCINQFVQLTIKDIEELRNYKELGEDRKIYFQKTRKKNVCLENFIKGITNLNFSYTETKIGMDEKEVIKNFDETDEKMFSKSVSLLKTDLVQYFMTYVKSGIIGKSLLFVVDQISKGKMEYCSIPSLLLNRASYIEPYEMYFVMYIINETLNRIKDDNLESLQRYLMEKFQKYHKKGEVLDLFVRRSVLIPTTDCTKIVQKSGRPIIIEPQPVTYANSHVIFLMKNTNFTNNDIVVSFKGLDDLMWECETTRPLNNYLGRAREYRNLFLKYMVKSKRNNCIIGVFNEKLFTAEELLCFSGSIIAYIDPDKKAIDDMQAFEVLALCLLYNNDMFRSETFIEKLKTYNKLNDVLGMTIYRILDERSQKWINVLKLLLENNDFSAEKLMSLLKYLIEKAEEKLTYSQFDKIMMWREKVWSLIDTKILTLNTNDRYKTATQICENLVKKMKQRLSSLDENIDKNVTNRLLADMIRINTLKLCFEKIYPKIVTEQQDEPEETDSDSELIDQEDTPIEKIKGDNNQVDDADLFD